MSDNAAVYVPEPVPGWTCAKCGGDTGMQGHLVKFRGEYVLSCELTDDENAERIKAWGRA